MRHKLGLESRFDEIVEDLGGFLQFEQNSFLHVRELLADEIREGCLSCQSFYTADGVIYSLEGEQKTPTLFLTEGKYNPVLRNLGYGFDGWSPPGRMLIGSGYPLRKKGIYYPSLKEVEEAMNSSNTLRVDLTKLRFWEESSDLFVRFNPVKLWDNDLDLKSFNAEEEKILKWMCGEDYLCILDDLYGAGINEMCLRFPPLDEISKDAANGPFCKVFLREEIQEYDETKSLRLLADYSRVDCHHRLRGELRSSVGDKQRY